MATPETGRRDRQPRRVVGDAQLEAGGPTLSGGAESWPAARSARAPGIARLAQ